MQFDQIVGLAAAEPVLSQAQKDEDLGRTDFLTMLVAQLSNQDPLNPQDSTEFTAQLAQFTSVEQLLAMRSSMDALVEKLGSDQGMGGLSQATGNLLAASLIGKEVVASSSDFSLDTSGGAGADPVFDPTRDRVPRLSFELEGPTSVTRVSIRNERGAVVGEELGPIELGGLPAGRVDLSERLVGDYLRDAGLPAGNYSFEVVAERGPLDPAPTAEVPNPPHAERESVGWKPLVGGLVTGTSLVGDEPLLLVGNALIPVSDVLEVRSPGGFGGGAGK